MSWFGNILSNIASTVSSTASWLGEVLSAPFSSAPPEPPVQPFREIPRRGGFQEVVLEDIVNRIQPEEINLIEATNQDVTDLITDRVENAIIRAGADPAYRGSTSYYEIVGGLDYYSDNLYDAVRRMTLSNVKCVIRVYTPDDEINPQYAMDVNHRVRYRVFRIDGQDYTYFNETNLTLSENALLSKRNDERPRGGNRVIQFSDWEVVYDARIIEVVFSRIPVRQEGRGRRVLGGNFFKYWYVKNNTSDAVNEYLETELGTDLSRYQIYEKGDCMNKKVNLESVEHCLLHSLHMHGLDVNEATLVKIGVTNDHEVRITKLGELAKELDIQIVLHRYVSDQKGGYSDKRINRYNRQPGLRVLDLGLIEGHFIVYEDLDVYKSEIGLLEDGKRDVLIKHSLQLVKLMFEKGLFEPLDTDILLNSLDNFKVSSDTLFKDPTGLASIKNADKERKEHYLMEIDADFETFPKVGDSHIPYLIGYLYTELDGSPSEEYKCIQTTARPGKIFLTQIQIRAESYYDAILSYANVRFKNGEVDTRRYYFNTISKNTVLNISDREVTFSIPSKYENLQFLNDMEPISLESMRRFLTSVLPVKVYFHNLRYDFSFFNEYLTGITSYMGNVSNVKRISAHYWNSKLIIQDNYSILPASISKIPDMLGLKLGGIELKKGIMPYLAYNPDVVWRDSIYLSDARPFIRPEQWEDFMKEVKEGGYYLEDDNGEGMFYHMRYVRKYCKYDLIIQREGRKNFISRLEKALQYDCVDPITISGIALDIQEKAGVFEDVAELKGSLSEKVRKFMCPGGRTMLAFNKKCDITGRLSYDDACSLYPSSQYRLKGYPKGLPKLLPEGWYSKEAREAGYPLLSSYTHEQGGFFITIRLLNIPIKRAFSVFFIENKTGREYTCDVPEGGVIWHMNVIDWEIFTKFYGCRPGIDFYVTSGIYFNEGINEKLETNIDMLYELRREYKAMLVSSDPAVRAEGKTQETIKLVLNSTWGKNAQRPFNMDMRIISSDRLEDCLNKEGHHVVEYIPINSDSYMVYSTKIPKYSSKAHCASLVLSMSKLIMAEVMCLAEDLGINIYYTDTDSYIIEEEGRDRLAEEYERIYNRKLCGKKMGQFHSDFPDWDGEGELDKTKAPYAKRLIAVGKKTYYMEVVYTLVDGTEVSKDVIKSKGIPKGAIKAYCKDNGLTPAQFYQSLYEGEEHDIPMIYDEFKPSFQFTNTMRVVTRKQYTRKMKF